MVITRYAHKHAYGNDIHYRDIYESIIQVKMCEDKDPQKRYLIKLEVNSEGRYWGWLSYIRNRYGMIYPRKYQLEMCFPYGIEIAVSSKQGEVVRFNVIHSEEIENEVVKT